MNVKFCFRSKSSGRVINKSQVCMSYQADFYNIVLSHGDGSLENYPDRELCEKSNFINDDPIAFCVCRYIDLIIAFYIFSLRWGFNQKVDWRNLWGGIRPRWSFGYPWTCPWTFGFLELRDNQPIQYVVALTFCCFCFQFLLQKKMKTKLRRYCQHKLGHTTD